MDTAALAHGVGPVLLEPPSPLPTSIDVTSPVAFSETSDQEPKVSEEVMMKRRVFVGNVARSCTNEYLLGALKAIIPGVDHVNIIRERDTDISKGYGFVTFLTEEQAQACMGVKNVTIHNRILNFGPAKRKDKKHEAEQRHHPQTTRRNYPPPANYGGGGGGGSSENMGYPASIYGEPAAYPAVYNGYNGYNGFPPEEYGYYDPSGGGYPGMHPQQYAYPGPEQAQYNPRGAEAYSPAGGGHANYRSYRTPPFYPPPTHSPAYSSLSPGSAYSASPRDGSGGHPQQKFVFPVGQPGQQQQKSHHHALDKDLDMATHGLQIFTLSHAESAAQ